MPRASRGAWGCRSRNIIICVVVRRVVSALGVLRVAREKKTRLWLSYVPPIGGKKSIVIFGDDDDDRKRGRGGVCVAAIDAMLCMMWERREFIYVNKRCNFGWKSYSARVVLKMMPVEIENDANTKGGSLDDDDDDDDG